MAKIVIGGKERNLFIGTLALSFIEEELGSNFLLNPAKLITDFNFRALIAMYQGALMKELPDIDKMTVANWLDELVQEGRQEEVINVLFDALIEQGIIVEFRPHKLKEKKTEKKSSKAVAVRLKAAKKAKKKR